MSHVNPLAPAISAEDDPLYTQPEAASYLRAQERTLTNWRSMRKGPAYVKVGERLVRYRKSALDAFLSGAAGKAAA